MEYRPANGARWAAGAAWVLLLAAFAFLNRGERVALNVGVTVIYQLPLVALVYGAFILGMVAMFLYGLRQDRKVRRLLREQQRHRTPPWASPLPPEPPPP